MRSASPPPEHSKSFALLSAGPPKKSLPQKTAGERKYITVLFSDLSDYTALTSRLDPEEVKDIIAQLSRKIRQVVVRYEGFIEKYIGDAVMAVFGAARSYEDDPVRAILAAGKIHELTDTYSSMHRKRIGQTLAMHTGIDTGLAVTGDVDFNHGTHGIAGATLNLAARLCSLAKPGEILVGSETYRQAIGYFNFETLEPATVKGLSSPIQVHKVVSRIDSPKKIRRSHGLRAELIGRNPELEQLSDALNRVQSGKGCLVSLCGNAGTGKSRLIEDFKSACSPKEVNWREGHCYPYTRNITYFPLIDLINKTLGIEESDPPNVLREKIESGLEFVENKSDVIPYVGSLYNLGYSQLEGISPDTWRHQFQKAILKILTVMARRAPTIICLEDLHWADPSSLELIRYLLADFQYPALVICVYRPTLTFLNNQQVANLGESCVEIRLEDLSPAETQTMVRSLLQTPHIPLELQRFVREKAGGNPFYLEELINSLVENSMLRQEAARWVVEQSLETSELSSTIHGVIAARIDRLESEMKGILQEAAVIGRTFSYEILSQITRTEETLWHQLSSLETLDLIKVRSYKPAVEYMFKHALTQEVVYQSLLKTKRKAIHERVGSVMEVLFEDRLADHYEALAFHFQHGQSFDKAVDYLAKSGEKSLGRYALEEAHRYYRNAFTIIGSHSEAIENSDALRIELLNNWAFVYYYRGQYKELLALLENHRADAENLSDKNKTGIYHAWLGCALWHRERFIQAHRHLQTALEIGEEKGNSQVIGYACCWLTWVCAELGLLQEALAYAERAQKTYRPGSREDYVYVSALAGAGYACWHRGDSSSTRRIGNALLDFGQKHSNYRAMVMGLCCMGWSDLAAGDQPQAALFFEKALQTSIDPWYGLFPRLALVYGRILEGKPVEVQAPISELLDFSRRFGAEFVGGPALFFQGLVRIAQGETDEGLQIMENQYRSWVKSGSVLRSTTCGLILANVYADLHRKARSCQDAKLAQYADRKTTACFRNTVDAARRINLTSILHQAYADWGRYCRENGDAAQAEKYFAKAAALRSSTGQAQISRPVS